MALAAACAATGGEDRFDQEAAVLAPRFEKLSAEPREFPRGVSGFVMQTVPAAIGCWKRHPRDLREAIEDAISLGGDSDTVGAIVGGIVGAADPSFAIPEDWSGFVGWLGPKHVERALGHSGRLPGYPAMLLGHLLVLPIILGHGFRRLAPW